MSTGLLPSSLGLLSTECSISYGTGTMSTGLLPSSLCLLLTECSIGSRTVTMSSTTACSCLLTWITEGEPSASSVKDQASATAENSFSAMAGTSVPQGRPGLPPQQKRPGTLPQQRLGSAPQHTFVRIPPWPSPEHVHGSYCVDTTCVVNVLIEGFMFGIVSCVKNDP